METEYEDDFDKALVKLIIDFDPRPFFICANGIRYSVLAGSRFDDEIREKARRVGFEFFRVIMDKKEIRSNDCPLYILPGMEIELVEIKSL